MEDDYDFSKAQRGRTPALRPIEELAKHTKVTKTMMVDSDVLAAFGPGAETPGVVPVVSSPRAPSPPSRRARVTCPAHREVVPATSHDARARRQQRGHRDLEVRPGVIGDRAMARLVRRA
jgi:hypothetical protein